MIAHMRGPMKPAGGSGVYTGEAEEGGSSTVADAPDGRILKQIAENAGQKMKKKSIFNMKRRNLPAVRGVLLFIFSRSGKNEYRN